jgi:hypothetical protein
MTTPFLADERAANLVCSALLLERGGRFPDAPRRIL